MQRQPVPYATRPPARPGRLPEADGSCIPATERWGPPEQACRGARREASAQAAAAGAIILLPYATRPPARPGRPNVGECFRSGGAAADVLGEARPRSIRSLYLTERPDVSVGILCHQSSAATSAPLGQSMYILYQPFTPFTSYISHDKHKLVHIFQ